MKILADTSVWIEHFRSGRTSLTPLLSEGLVVMHPYVAGELACGNLKSRHTILVAMQSLPQAAKATDAEVLHFIESRHLFGKGLGWIDMHLLASALLSDCRLWTLDARLHAAATNLALAAVM